MLYHHFHIHHHNEREDILMTISAQVQSVLDQVKLNTSLEQSADLALQALSAQIKGLSDQISTLEGQVAAGATLGADDIAALATTVNDLQTSATKLQADIPANTPAA